MTAKTKTSHRLLPRPLTDKPPPGPWYTPPLNAEESLQRIQALGQRINGHISYLEKVGTLNGISAETKDRAVAAFYERLLVLERQLARIQEDLELG